MSSQLRLSSYMYGRRVADEEMFDIRSWLERLRDGYAGWDRRYSKFRGGFRRAPAVDSLMLPPNKRALLVVDEIGVPTSEEDLRLMHLQDEACRKMGLVPEESFELLYVPPHFRTRIYLFILSFWLSSAFACLASFAIPIYVGRACVHATGREPLHDGYTWSIGVYVIWMLMILSKELQRLARRGLQTPQRMAKAAVSWAIGVAYLATALLVVIPILLALVINFYLVLPVRLDLGLSKPVIHLVDIWALGLVYMKIGESMSRWHPPNRHTHAFRRVCSIAFTF